MTVQIAHDCCSCRSSNTDGPLYKKMLVLRCGLEGNRHILYAKPELPERHPSPSWCPLCPVDEFAEE